LQPIIFANLSRSQNLRNTEHAKISGFTVMLPSANDYTSHIQDVTTVKLAIKQHH